MQSHKSLRISAAMLHALSKGKSVPVAYRHQVMGAYSRMLIIYQHMTGKGQQKVPIVKEDYVTHFHIAMESVNFCIGVDNLVTNLLFILHTEAYLIYSLT
jgi:hypothetical protein